MTVKTMFDWSGQRLALALVSVFQCFSLYLCLGLSSAAYGGEAAVTEARAALQERLSALNPFHAHFAQFVEGARGQVLEESTGELLLARPSFRWQVDEPYPQIIVADGERLSVYDPDLEQVMVRAFSEALADTPVALLTQADLALSAQFDVLLLPGLPGEADVFLLTPKGEDSLLQELQLHFVDATLTEMQLFDHLGQSTTVRFKAIDLAGAVDPAAFKLDLPAYVDVIEG